MKTTSNKNYYWAEMGARLKYVALDGSEIMMINTREGRVRATEIINGKAYKVDPDVEHPIDLVTRPKSGDYIIREATELEVATNCSIDSRAVKHKFKGSPNLFKGHVRKLRAWYKTEPICVLLVTNPGMPLPTPTVEEDGE